MAALHKRLGLDRPICAQYVDSWRKALTGDSGGSMVTGRPIIERDLACCRTRIDLTLAALVFGIVSACRSVSGRRCTATA